MVAVVKQPIKGSGHAVHVQQLLQVAMATTTWLLMGSMPSSDSIIVGCGDVRTIVIFI
jgi:hypothetical protein